MTMRPGMKKSEINDLTNKIDWYMVANESKEEFSTILNNLNLLYTNYDHVSAVSNRDTNKIFAILGIIAGTLLFAIDPIISMTVIFCFEM